MACLREAESNAVPAKFPGLVLKWPSLQRWHGASGNMYLKDRAGFAAVQVGGLRHASGWFNPSIVLFGTCKAHSCIAPLLHHSVETPMSVFSTQQYRLCMPGRFGITFSAWPSCI